LWSRVKHGMTVGLLGVEGEKKKEKKRKRAPAV
jgi:hypothetical protein